MASVVQRYWAAAAGHPVPTPTPHADSDPRMATVAPGYWASAVGHPVPTPHTDSDLGSGNTRSSDALVAQLKLLEDKSERIEEQKIKIIDALEQLKVNFPSREVQLIAFVKALEKAVKYFELKDHLKDNVGHVMHDSVAIDSFRCLVKQDRVQDKFKELDYQDIFDAVEERILDLQIKRYEDDKLKQNNKNVSPCSRKEKKQLALLDFAEKGAGQVLNPFLGLVFHIREKSYALHKDPYEELDIMKKCNPYFYNHCFIAGLRRKFSEKTVIVRNLPRRYGVNEVKEAFSACGEVTFVNLERLGEWGSMAHVTFKYSEGAKLAPFLKGELFLSVFPVLEEYPECQSDITVELIEALFKYRAYRAFYRVSREQVEESADKWSPTTECDA